MENNYIEKRNNDIYKALKNTSKMKKFEDDNKNNIKRNNYRGSKHKFDIKIVKKLCEKYNLSEVRIKTIYNDIEREKGFELLSVSNYLYKLNPRIRNALLRNGFKNMNDILHPHIVQERKHVKNVFNDFGFRALLELNKFCKENDYNCIEFNKTFCSVKSGYDYEDLEKILQNIDNINLCTGVNFTTIKDEVKNINNDK